MLVYITATILTVGLCAWLCPKTEQEIIDLAAGGSARKICQRKKIISCVICMLPLLAVMSCRWCLGIDMWHTYTPGYLAIKSETVPLSEEEEKILLTCNQLKLRWYGASTEVAKKSTLEQAYAEYLNDYHHTGKGFQLLERFLALLHADVQWFYFLTSFLVIGLIFSSIWIQSTRPVWAALFFIITANFFLAINVIAQYIAVAICVFACTFAEKRKPIWFFLLVAIASTIHLSAIVFLPVYFLPKLKIKPVWCAIAVIAALILSQFAYPVIKQLVLWIAPKYENYISGWTGGAEFEWIFFGINCAVFALSTYYYPKGKDLPYYRLWYYLNVLAMIAMAFSGIVPWIKRVNYYYAAPHFLLIPMALGLEKNKTRKIALHMITVVLFCAEIYVAIWKLNKHGTLPYMAFFQGDRVELMQPMFEQIIATWHP